MSETTSANFTGGHAFTWETEAKGAPKRVHVARPAEELDLHTHGSGLGLPVTRIGTASASGALDMASNVISNIGAAGTDFSATGGLTLADALTVAANGASVTGASTITDTASTTATRSNTTVTGTHTATASVDALRGGYINQGFTVNNGVTVTRAAQLWLEGVTATLNGTGAITSQNSLYVGTPGNSGAPISSATTAHLNSAGNWINAPSWSQLKRDIQEVERSEAARLFDFLASDAFKPIRYFTADHFEDVEVPTFEDQLIPNEDGEGGRTVRVLTGFRVERQRVRYHPEGAYAHFGYRLDDLPQELREIVCSDAHGGISSKDEAGLLAAMVQEGGRRINELSDQLAQALDRIAALETRLSQLAPSLP